MKKKFAAIGFVILSLLIFNKTQAQDQFAGSQTGRLVLLTDRTLYVAGEEILFSARLYSGIIDQRDLNRVLYTELVTPDGDRAVGGKFLIDSNTSRGSLSIPANLITGNYYLRAYTRSMRNFGPQSFTYIGLKIVNPYRNEILELKPEDRTGLNTINSSEINELSDAYLISMGKETYGKNEEVKVSISMNPSGKEKDRKICVTVVPDSALQIDLKQIKINNPGIKENKFYPETRGVSLSGHLMNSTGKIPLSGKVINLSVLGEKDFMSYRTDSSGSFYFSFPDYIGSRNIFLSSEKNAGMEPLILVDNDFCPLQLKMPSPTFHLTEKEREIIFNSAQNEELSKIFYTDTTKLNSKKNQILPFYGEPTEFLYLDKYIQLPSMEECFNELPLAVKVRKKQGKKILKFYTAVGAMLIYDPLVLIDMIAIDNTDKILALDPTVISRIELVDALYVKGDMTYGGIISIISKEANFGGIDLPSSGYFINYNFLNDTSTMLKPGENLDNVPDTRNVLYWNPDLLADDQGKLDFSFRTSNLPGKYTIILREAGSDGEINIERKSFIVR